MANGGFFRPRLIFSRAETVDRSSSEAAERFRRLVLPHMDAAYTLARYLTRDPASAEDIVQEAFLHAYRGFDEWRGDAPKTWLLTIVRNCFLNSVGSSEARAKVADIAEWQDSPPSELIDRRTPESVLAEKSETEMLRKTIEDLPEPFREALILRELEELSYKQIATITQAPIGTVMSRLARARQMLADLLLPQSTAQGGRA
jgi:RNA polymerase sigma factor (sigma-70 family)